MSNVLNEIKLLLIHHEITMTDLVNILNEEYDRSEAQSNFHRKLAKETIRYTEILEIAEALGYRIAWVPKKIKLDTEQTGVFYSAASKIKLERERSFQPSVIASRKRLMRSLIAQKKYVRKIEVKDDNKEEPSK